MDRTVMWGDMGGGVDSSDGRGWGEWCRLTAVTVEGAGWRPVIVEMGREVDSSDSKDREDRRVGVDSSDGENGGDRGDRRDGIDGSDVGDRGGGVDGSDVKTEEGINL